MLRLAWQEPRCRASIQEAHRLLFWSREEKATFTALMAPELHWRAKGQTEYLGDVVADVESRKPDWLLPPWLRRGKVHELVGKPKVGKSTLTIWLAGQVFDKNQTGTVVIFTTEDDTAEDIRPRCMLAGVDMRRIVVYSKAIHLCRYGKADCDNPPSRRGVGGLRHLPAIPAKQQGRHE